MSEKAVRAIIVAVGVVMVAGCAGLSPGGNESVLEFSEQTGVPAGTLVRALYSFDNTEGQVVFNGLLDEEAQLHYAADWNGVARVSTSGGETVYEIGRLPTELDSSNDWIYTVAALMAAEGSRDADAVVAAGAFYGTLGRILDDGGYSDREMPPEIEAGMEIHAVGGAAFEEYVAERYEVSEGTIGYRQ